jgi:tight adherence protein B
MRGRVAALGCAAACALTVLAASAAAAPGVRIAGTETGGYPHLIVNAITSTPHSRPPALRENGRPVSGFQAANLGAAKSVVVAIDNSRSMAGSSLGNAAAAARTFIRAKGARDRISVISFGHRAVQLTGFSTSSAQADGVLQGLSVDRTTGTALYDAVFAAAKALRSSNEPGRVIVLLTDGHDVSSNSTLDAAVAAARRADAAVYPIGIESKDFDPSALREIASATGGTYHGAGSSADLERVYGSIASELERTWRLGYDTAARPGEQIRLRVTEAGAGSAERVVDVPSEFGSVAAAPPKAVLPGFAFSAAGTLAISLLVGASIVAALLTLFRIRRRSWLDQRLAPHVPAAMRSGEGRTERLSVFKALFRATETALGRRSEWRTIERLLVRGDVPLRPAEFVWLIIGCGIAGLAVVGAAGASPVIALLGMFLGGAMPYGFVTLKVRRRVKAFEDQLPDLLSTIAASLKAGHSFKHGLQAVLEEAQPPASDELRRVLTEAGLGRPIDDALGDMADRLGSENFGFAITAVTIQRQVGGSLATLFDMVSETVRNRQQFARKIRSLTAMGRMSAYTLVGVPFFIGAVVSLMNPSYMRPLFHSHAGHMLLLLGLTMMGLGSLVLKKIVSFRG